MQKVKMGKGLILCEGLQDKHMKNIVFQLENSKAIYIYICVCVYVLSKKQSNSTFSKGPLMHNGTRFGATYATTQKIPCFSKKYANYIMHILQQHNLILEECRCQTGLPTIQSCHSLKT